MDLLDIVGFVGDMIGSVGDMVGSVGDIVGSFVGDIVEFSVLILLFFMIDFLSQIQDWTQFEIHNIINKFNK